MKHIPADCAAHALAAAWSFATVAGAAVQSVAPDIMSDERALIVALGAGAAASVLAMIASKGDARERAATLLSSLGFAVAFGPIVAHLLMAKYGIDHALTTQMMIGTSAFFALLGWPVYKLALALFVASGENANGIGQFFGAFAKAFLRRGQK